MAGVACSEVRHEDGGDGGASSVVVSAAQSTASVAVSSSSVAAATTVSTSLASSSSSTGLDAPRLPPCRPTDVDDFSDPVASAARWYPPDVDGGVLRLDDGNQTVSPVDSSVQPFEDCFLSLRVQSATTYGSYHCHLDPGVDFDHDYVNVDISPEGTWVGVLDGSGQGNGFNTERVPFGTTVVVVFEGATLRVLALGPDGAIVELHQGVRPAFFDVPFSPCGFGVFDVGEVLVDDVNVLPIALFAL